MPRPKKPWSGWRHRAKEAAMVAAAAAGVLASPALAAPMRVAGDGFEGTRRGEEAGGRGGAAAAGEGVVAGRSGASGGLPINTVVVVDAGSSGCRLNVYRMEGEGDSLKVSGTSAGKIEPGLSSFADSPSDVAAYIVPLFEKASELVPVENHLSTKVYIKSTAGMRLLPEETQDALYDEIYEALVMDPGFPFALDRAAVGTIDGDKEAFYAVLSANYLEGRIDARLHPTGHGAGEIGALDMGGASTQIIFRHKEAANEQQQQPQPQQEEEGDEWSARESGSGGYGPLDDRRVPSEAIEGRGSVPTVPVSQSDFWGASHLGFGVAEVRLRIWDSLVSDRSSVLPSVSPGGVSNEIPNPCSFVGRVDAWKGHRLIGTGDHSLCETTVASVLWGGRVGGGEGGDEVWAEEEEVARARGVGGVSMPALNGEFLAMSVFFFAMHCLHELGPAELTAWPAPTLAELRTAAEGFCAMDWRALSLDDTGDVDHQFTGSAEGLAHRCVEVVYMTTLLRDGYGFPEHSRNVTYALESDGMELEWTLGYALVELAQFKEIAELEEPEELAELEESRELEERRELEQSEGFRKRQGREESLEEVEGLGELDEFREHGKQEGFKEMVELEEPQENQELQELQELEESKEINKVGKLAQAPEPLTAEAAAGGGGCGGGAGDTSVGAGGTAADAPAVVPGAGAGVAEMPAENAARCARAVKTSIADMDGECGGGGGGGGGGTGGGGGGSDTEAFALPTGDSNNSGGGEDGVEGGSGDGGGGCWEGGGGGRGGGEANADSLPKKEKETSFKRLVEGDDEREENVAVVVVVAGEEEEEEEEGGGVTWLEECPAGEGASEASTYSHTSAASATAEGLDSSHRAPGRRGRKRGRGEGGSSREGTDKALVVGEVPRERGVGRGNSNGSSSSSSGTCGVLAGKEAAVEAAVAVEAEDATWSARLGSVWKSLWKDGAEGEGG